VSNIFEDIDQVFEVLDDKIVRTDQGSFIKVDDLKEFHKQVREASAEQRQALIGRPKTFAGARELAKKDPLLQPAPQAPRAPALSSVKGVSTPEV
jgi:hypothetical protein